MNTFRADLHIHTVLSPCSNLEMSPGKIVSRAKEQKLDIIGVTDHNSTRNCKLLKKLGEELGLYVLMGVEVTTREEVHCLAFFEKDNFLDEFQQYLENNLPYIKNDTDYFGYQVVVDENENILDEIDSLLIVGINKSIDEVHNMVRKLNGIFIPAHVDRPRNSLISQLGFLPEDICPDAIEINGTSEKTDFIINHPEFSRFSLIKNSDAHMLSQIGRKYSDYKLENISFREISFALNQKHGREVVIP